MYVLTLHRRGHSPEIIRSTADKSFALAQKVLLERNYPHGRIEITETTVQDYPRRAK